MDTFGGGGRYTSGGGYPYFGHFLAILGISGRENGTPPRGPSQRPSQGCIWALDMQRVRNTPSGGPLRCTHTVSSGRLVWHTEIAKSAQNRGTPLSDQFFSKVAPLQTVVADFRKKKVRKISPSGPSAGGENHTFFRKSATAWSGMALPSKNRVI